MRGRVCPRCRRRTLIYIHGCSLSYCTNKECDFEAKNSTYEKYCEKYPRMAPNSRDVFDRIPGLLGLVSKEVVLTEEILAIGLHAISVEERIEQGYIQRQVTPPFEELQEESQDVYRVLARFIMKYFVSKV
ncbi:MAG: hypothetical protein KAU24_03815 [Candidatus Aenigmarchaeota archaeon]|nr:hypothetical protein [Candidatus Aenigmarchaeota archaeon]